jgi:serine/threonine protein kinase
MDTIGPYNIVRKIAEGGNGIVYLGRNPDVDVLEAIKVIRPEFLGDDVSRESFRRGARALTMLATQPNILGGAYGQSGDTVYWVMPYLERGSLAEEKNRKQFLDNPKAAARFMIKVAAAIQFAHRRGIIHRDLKPENILLDEAGEPQVVDFGLAKILGDISDSASQGSDSGGNRQSQTRTLGVEISLSAPFIGTARFASPEMARIYFESGSRPEEWKMPALIPMDVYGLGVVLYYLVTGHIPYPGNGFEKVLDDIANPSVQPEDVRVLNPKISGDLKDIIDMAMHGEPDGRYGNTGEFRKDLENYLSRRPVRASRPSFFKRTKLWILRNRELSAVLILLAGLATTAGGIYSRERYRKGVWENAIREATTRIVYVAKLHSLLFMDHIEDLASPLVAMSENPDVLLAAKGGDRAWFRRWLVERHRRSQEAGAPSAYASWFILDDRGEMLARSPPSSVRLPAEKVKKRDYFKGAKALSGLKETAKIHRSSFVYKSLIDFDFAYKLSLSVPIDSEEGFEGVLVFSVPTSKSLGIKELEGVGYRVALIAPMDPSLEDAREDMSGHRFVVHPRFESGQKAVRVPEDLQVELDKLVDQAVIDDYKDAFEDRSEQTKGHSVAALMRVPNSNFVVLTWSHLTLLGER